MIKALKVVKIALKIHILLIQLMITAKIVLRRVSVKEGTKLGQSKVFGEMITIPLIS